MGSFNSNVWGYIVSGTLIESERARLRSSGFVYEKPKTKRLRVSVMNSFLFGSIGMIYISLSSVLIMLLMNALLFSTTITVVYFTGNYAWLLTGFLISKVCTVGLAITITENYNEKVLEER